MLNLNVISCIQNAYLLVWQERKYLLKLAAIPILIKFAFYSLSSFYVDEGNIIRLSLFMIPSYFAEGWLLCHFVRLITNGQRWPYQMSGNEVDDMRALKARGRPLIAGVLSFVLINLALALYFAIFTHFTPAEIINGDEIKPEDIPQGTAITLIFLFAVMVAGFKLVWLYISVAANISPIIYIKKSRGFALTVRFIALWLLCFVPVMFLMQLILSPFLMSDTSITSSAHILVSIVTIIFDTLKNIIVTAGMTYAVLQIVRGGDKGFSA